VVPAPASAAPAGGDVGRDDQVGLVQAAPVVQDPAQQCGGDGEGRVGHDAKRSTGEAEVGGIGLDHTHVVTEATTKSSRSTGMMLDGDHLSAGGEQVPGDGAGPGADVDDELSGGDVGPCHQAPGPAIVELVPAPASGGHGTSSWSS